jgi:hypothetical protein
MEEKAETSTEERSRGFASYSVWAGVVVLAYFLSIGPFVMMEDKRGWRWSHPRWLDTLYFPTSWAYTNTRLHKPIGMYLHMWCPKPWDSNGYPIH